MSTTQKGARGNVIIAVGVLFGVLIQCYLTHAARTFAHAPTTYTVGDHYGWDDTVSMEAWPKGKTFYAGDILVFKYDYQSHDVVVVNKAGHDSCTVNAGATKYESGNDKIQLAFGDNFFIDSTPDNCQAGMKMAINALAPPP